jgi:hypothetical protein
LEDEADGDPYGEVNDEGVDMDEDGEGEEVEDKGAVQIQNLSKY